MRAHPIHFEQLVDYVDGRLGDAARVAVEAHLATGCPTCRKDVAWLTRVLGAARVESLALAEPPLELVLQVKRTGDAVCRRAANQARSGNALAWLRRPALRLASLAMALVLSSTVYMTQASALFERHAVLSQLDGLVEVQSRADEDWRPLSAGSRLREGDHVRVAGGTAVVTFFEGSRMDIHEGSELTLASLRSGLFGLTYQIVVDQPSGSVAYDVAPSASSRSRFDVGSSGATVMAGGDSFEVTVSAEDEAQVVVLSGEVQVETAQGHETVQENEVVVAAPSKPLVRLPTPTPTATPLPAATNTATAQPTDTARPKPTRTPGAEHRPTTPAPTREVTRTPAHAPTLEGTPTLAATRTPWSKPDRTPGARESVTPLPNRTPQVDATRTKIQPGAKTPLPAKTGMPTRTLQPTATPAPTATPQPPEEVEFSGPIRRYPSNLVGVWKIGDQSVRVENAAVVHGKPHEGLEANVKAVRGTENDLIALRIKVRQHTPTPPTAPTATSPPVETAPPPATPTAQPQSATETPTGAPAVTVAPVGSTPSRTATARKMPSPTATPQPAPEQTALALLFTATPTRPIPPTATPLKVLSPTAVHTKLIPPTATRFLAPPATSTRSVAPTATPAKGAARTATPRRPAPSNPPRNATPRSR